MRRSMIGIGSLALLGGIAFAQQTPQQPQNQPVGQGAGQSRVGAAAPQMNLFDLKGQVFVLEFVNPTDEKWVELHKDKRFGKDGKLAETYAKYQAENVIWLTICPYQPTTGTAVGGTGEVQGIAKMNLVELRETVKELDLDRPILFDEGGKIMKSFGINAIPHVVLIDKQGKIAYFEKLRGETGELVGVDTFDRAVGTAINASDDASTLPAGAPRDQGIDRTTPRGDTGVDRDRMDRERLERERLERERLERERLEQNRPR